MAGTTHRVEVNLAGNFLGRHIVARSQAKSTCLKMSEMENFKADNAKSLKVAETTESGEYEVSHPLSHRAHKTSFKHLELDIIK